MSNTIEQFKDILSLNEAEQIKKYGKDNLKQIKSNLLGWFNESNKENAAKCFQHILEYKHPDNEIIHIIWSAEDIKNTLDEHYPEIDYTEEDIQNLLFDLDHNHDACIGISWDTIEAKIHCMFFIDR